MTRSWNILQEILLPDTCLLEETEAYLNLRGGATFEFDGTCIWMTAGSQIDTGTFYNSFPFGDWRVACRLNDLAVLIVGQGRFSINVVVASPGRSWSSLERRIVDLSTNDASCRIPLTDNLPETGGSILFVEIIALTSGQISKISWCTRQEPCRRPDILISMTTFKREVEALSGVRRISSAIEKGLGSGASEMSVLVVDNGGTFILPDDLPGVRVVKNPNKGGSGGFARALLEARSSDHSHVIFMDDDAACRPEGLERIAKFLSYALDDRTAIAGAMIDGRHRWRLWEMGARFTGLCEPIGHGTDLRDTHKTIRLLMDVSYPPPSDMYGGWWLFAFPVSAVRFFPFPFFVRGDDVSFSLANSFPTVRLPGVASYQDGFSARETPFTTYLDLRSHLAHMLSLPMLHRDTGALVKVPLRFAARALFRMHYDSLDAVTSALRAVLCGPREFIEDEGLSEVRAALTSGTITEMPKPLPHHPSAGSDPISSKFMRMLMKITLNGHLLPGFRIFGRHRALIADEKGAVGGFLGLSRATIYDPAGRKGYEVRHSKLRAMKSVVPFLLALFRLAVRHRTLRKEWTSAYPELTSAEFWQRSLGLDVRRD